MNNLENPVDRMLSRMQYEREDGEPLEGVLEQLRQVKQHSPSHQLMEEFNALVRQGRKLTPPQRVNLLGAMDAVLRCAQAMEEAGHNVTPEMDDYYGDTQGIAMEYAAQLSRSLREARVNAIQGIKDHLLQSLERGGINAAEISPLSQPQSNAELPPGWQQPSLFAQESLSVQISDAAKASGTTPPMIEEVSPREDLSLHHDRRASTDEEVGVESDPLKNTVTAQGLGPLSYDAPMSYTGEEKERGDSNLDPAITSEDNLKEDEDGRWLLPLDLSKEDKSASTGSTAVEAAPKDEVGDDAGERGTVPGE